jgi:hypothetical protein
MTHSRLLFFKPEEWLVVADRLSPSDSDEHNYKQWFHFAEDLNISRSDDGFVASGIALEEELYITNLLGTNDKATGPIASQIEPSLQGWYSPFTNVLEPSPAIAFDKQQSGIATFATLMAFSDGDIRVLGDNSFNNNGGNFSWEENGKAHSLGYSLTGNGEIKVEFSEQ